MKTIAIALALSASAAAVQAHAQLSQVPEIHKTGPCCGRVTPTARRVLKLLNDSDIEQLWQNGRHINWETGEPDRPADYQGSEMKTHCSAFAAAMGERLGVYMLRPPQHSQELLANAQTEWFDSMQGRQAGWSKVDSPQQAQVLANLGQLVVVSYQSPDRHHPGHIGIVRPDANRTLDEIKESGILMTQAGERNYLRVSEKTAFEHHPGAWPNGVQYFVHDIPSIGSSAP